MIDENSPIIDFYPADFDVDLNGKKFAWQGVALLPFVDEDRLLNALKEVLKNILFVSYINSYNSFIGVPLLNAGRSETKLQRRRSSIVAN